MATTVDQFGNVIEVITGEEQTNQQNRSYLSSGGIDDDSGSLQRFDDGSSIQTFEDGSTLVIDSDGNTSSTPAAPPTTNAGTTQAGKSGTPSGQTATPKPGKRLQNPLGNFSSYTYQISLYMITPDAYDAFIQTGRKNINAFQKHFETNRKLLKPPCPVVTAMPPHLAGGWLAPSNCTHFGVPR